MLHKRDLYLSILEKDFAVTAVSRIERGGGGEEGGGRSILSPPKAGLF